MKTYAKVILGLVIVVIIALAAWFIYSFINNGQKNFYVTYGNKTITGSADDIKFEKDKYTVIGCKTLTGQKVDYTVTITLKTDEIAGFDFEVDGGKTEFKRNFAGYDCTKLFKVEKSEEYFTMIVPGELTLTDIIQTKYPESAITGVPEYDLWAQDSFILTVIDKSEHTQTEISFH